ncbi:MAG TPA: septum formation initiator family protein [Rectinemataceae bacterium]
MRFSPSSPRKGGFFPVLGESISNAVCALLVSYCILSFFAGQAGILAYGDLKETIRGMEMKLGKLKEAETKLKAAKDALSEPGDWISREARGIGYLKPGEKIIILPRELRSESETRLASDGEILRVGQSTGLPDPLVKILSALICAAVFLASIMMSLFPSRKERRKVQCQAVARKDPVASA